EANPPGPGSAETAGRVRSAEARHRSPLSVGGDRRGPQVRRVGTQEGQRDRDRRADRINGKSTGARALGIASLGHAVFAATMVVLLAGVPMRDQSVTGGEDADIERNCTASNYGPGCIDTFLHPQAGVDARVPVPGLLRRYSGGRPTFSPETCRRERPLYRVCG